MTKEELKVKLDASQERVDKRLNTLSKVCKKLNLDKDEVLERAKNFDHPFTYNHARQEIGYDMEGVSDLYDNIFKLKDLEEVRNNWKTKYDAKVAEDSVEKVQVIWDFLTEWESKCIEWYLHNAERYYQLSQTFADDYEQYTIEYDETNPKPDSDDYSTMRRYENLRRGYFNRFQENYFMEINNLTKEVTRIRYNYKDGRQAEAISYVVDEDKLKKVIAQEKERKYKDLVTRVQDIVGTITNAEHLSIGNQNGELNGYVEGTNGKCSVETISAGGWNIQCYHYRVLIHRI